MPVYSVREIAVVDSSNHQKLISDSKLSISTTKPTYQKIISYVEPVLDVTYYTLLSPGRLLRDENGIYKWKHPGKLRKTVCTCIHLGLLFNVFTDLKQALEYDHQLPYAMASVYKIAYMAYLCFNITFLYVLWTKMGTLIYVLNESQKITMEAEVHVEKEYRLLPGVTVKNTCTCLKWLGIIFCILIWSLGNVVPDTHRNIIDHILHETSGIHGILLQSGKFFLNILKHPFDRNFNDSHGVNSSLSIGNTSSYIMEASELAYRYRNEYQFPIVETLGLLHTIVDVISTFCWITGDMFIAAWGAHFRKILHIICLKFNNRLSSTIDLKKTKQFIKTTILIEKFNQVMSYMVLINTLSETTYISTRTAGILMEKSSDIVDLLTSVVSFLPFTSALLAAAGINYKARQFPYLCKEQFVEWTGNEVSNNGAAQITNINVMGDTQTKNERDDDTVERRRGLMMIYHDLTTNVIGFQGFFFTVTYGFVGTVRIIICFLHMVMSGIATYSVIALQLASDHGKDQSCLG